MNITKSLWAAFLLLTLGASGALAQDGAEPTAEQQEMIAKMTAFWESLDRRTGDVELGDGMATLHVPEEFYFLSAADAETVLVELWGNPPGQNLLGMLFPSRYTPFDDDSWAVTIDYAEEGYVSDDDAADIDYDDMLRQMQKDTRRGSKDRVSAGYDSVELVGWAERPHYDAAARKLYWAKELAFGDMTETTLNYEIRALGRKGTLNMTFIAATSQLDEINSSRETVLAMAEFNDGYRYQDFDPSLDKVAAYGIGALIAGKVAMKTGFLAAGLIFLKKFGIFIVLGSTLR